MARNPSTGWVSAMKGKHPWVERVWYMDFRMTRLSLHYEGDWAFRPIREMLERIMAHC